MSEPLLRELNRLRGLVLDPEVLVKAVASGRQKGEQPTWRRAEMRYVDLKAGRHLQVTTYDATQAHTANHAEGDAARDAVDTLLDEPFGNWYVETTTQTHALRVTKKLEAVVHSRPEVALAAAYSVAIDGRGAEKVVVALVLRSGRDFEPRGLFDALRTELSDGQLPAFVRVLEAIPMTEGYRPIKSALRDERRPAQWAGQTFRLDLPRATYRPHSARKKTPSAKKAAPKKARPRKA